MTQVAARRSRRAPAKVLAILCACVAVGVLLAWSNMATGRDEGPLGPPEALSAAIGELDAAERAHRGETGSFVADADAVDQLMNEGWLRADVPFDGLARGAKVTVRATTGSEGSLTYEARLRDDWAKSACVHLASVAAGHGLKAECDVLLVPDLPMGQAVVARFVTSPSAPSGPPVVAARS